jgi:signal transduction histidine kinase
VPVRRPVRGTETPESALAAALFDRTARRLSRVEYLQVAASALLIAAGVDAVELWLEEDGRGFHCRQSPRAREKFSLATYPAPTIEALDLTTRLTTVSLARVYLRHASGATLAALWIADSGRPVVLPQTAPRRPALPRLRLAGPRRSLALLPLVVGEERGGVVVFEWGRPSPHNAVRPQTLESVAATAAIALSGQHAMSALHERVKELTCLYGITRLTEPPGAPLDDIIEGIVRLLPPAWQYPEICHARIVLDGVEYATAANVEGPHRQTAEIDVAGTARGRVEVVYTRRCPKLDEGPFLNEERKLIDAVARQLALVVERREAADDRSRLERQLRHADRLATIGQLAAGVAHELNEPLGTTLGFAQLALKADAVPGQVATDLSKIVVASLHAREVVKKLMLFARQTPPSTAPVNLNQIVDQSLYFLEARGARQEITVVRQLDPRLPDVVADPSQLQQVLVNLVVNAVQAMPNGGTLTIRTGLADGSVTLEVDDTGIGMSDEIKGRIFLPFFTTKDIDQGTGLGLAVVHGIVTAHGGTIRVDSTPGRGSRFTVELPMTGPPAEDLQDHAGKQRS